jgi:hypothetical protein
VSVSHSTTWYWAGVQKVRFNNDLGFVLNSLDPFLGKLIQQGSVIIGFCVAHIGVNRFHDDFQRLPTLYDANCSPSLMS